MAAGTRPLTLGEILDRTVQLYRRNFVLLVGIAAPPAAVMALVTGAVFVFFSAQIASFAPTAGQPAGQPPSQEALMVIGLVAIAFVIVGIPILLGVFAVALSALNYAASQVNRGEAVTIRGSYGFAFKHFWRYVGILFLQALLSWVAPYIVFIAIFVVGTILAALLAKSGAGNAFAPLFVIAAVVLILALIVVGVMLWIRFSLAFPVSVAEQKKAWPSMQRSGQLTKGSRGRIFVMFLLVWILSIVASVVLVIPVDIVIALTMKKAFTAGHTPTLYLTLIQVVNLAVGFLVRVFVMPIYVVALVLFYADQRTRIEGYDIEQLMAQAGWTEPPPLPVPAVQQFPPLPQSPETAMPPLPSASGVFSEELRTVAAGTVAENSFEAASTRVDSGHVDSSHDNSIEFSSLEAGYVGANPDVTRLVEADRVETISAEGHSEGPVA